MVRKKVKYDESAIQTLDALEHIRLRTGMYIGRVGDGSHPQDGVYILLKEVVDNAIDGVLEKKPEEKIWRVVRDNRCPEMEMPCYRLQKKDLIKVGRVRFKIRDIMSPIYREIENGIDHRYDSHREQFPSLVNESASCSVIHGEQESQE